LTAAAPRVVIAGGWTGGHLFCALAIAEALRRRDPATQLVLVGARGGREEGLIRAAGFPVETVVAAPLARGHSLSALAQNGLLPLKLAVGGVQALRLLRSFRPDVVVGVGAYVSVPVVAMAQALRIPTLLHEANAQPGMANRLLARGAAVVCVGGEPAVAAFARAARVVVTGNPVRPAVASAVPWAAAARARLGLDPARTTLLITGGSLGSARLNDWVLAHAAELTCDGAQVLWQCGSAHLAACQRRLGDAANLRLAPFLDDMATAYGAVDLVVAGAGASTIAELACLRKAAVFVPDPGVTEDHQTRNAEALRAAGASICDDASLGEGLVRQVRALLADAQQRRALGERLALLARPDAADVVAAEVVRLIS
jgi:UDP-N-acetylglucosamine--N-acetylmuramyl-(pentapeptide) pyrophosphoryl-undecaprenol N-acetylglucosamine transferase